MSLITTCQSLVIVPKALSLPFPRPFVWPFQTRKPLSILPKFIQFNAAQERFSPCALVIALSITDLEWPSLGEVAHFVLLYRIILRLFTAPSLK